MDVDGQDNIEQEVIGVKEGGHLDIVVTEVLDIDKFWINIRTTDKLGSMQKMMDCMDLFYKMEGRDLYPVKVCSGTWVAAPYCQDGYHRAKVISVVQDIVGLNYIDFGTVGVVNLKQLRKLPQMFRDLPSQAIECWLWGIETGQQDKARGSFLKLVERGNSYGGFVAIVKSIDIVAGQGERVGLWLVDTASNPIPDGLSVNYLLLEEGLVKQTTGLGIISSTGQILMSNLSSSCCSLLAAVDQELATCRYVQVVDMNGISVHIINLMGEGWVSSKDISILVGDWQGRDILALMLLRKKVELKSLSVSYSTHPDLVKQMVEEGVGGATLGVEQIRLYRLVNVPGMLNLFMVTKDRQRMSTVTAAIQQFDPASQFRMELSSDHQSSDW